MYRRILVPIDGSGTAARGLREAIRLAKAQHAKIRLVHVVDETMMLGTIEVGLDPTPLLRALAKQGRALLQRAKRLAGKLGVSAEVALYESTAHRAAEAILREAAKWHADLIVMGTHGRRGVRRLVLGSDAEQVVREARVPVLLVRSRS